MNAIRPFIPGLVNGPLWSVIALALMLAMGLYQLSLHWQMIIAPVPLDYYESTMVVITDLIARGDNPYDAALQPMKTDVYPPLANILTAPLSLVWGNTLVLHRAVSAVFLLVNTAFIYHVTGRLGGNRIDSACAAVLSYAATLYFGTPVASGNAVGLLLFYLCIYLPVIGRFSSTSLAWSLVCGLLAFYAKQYFVLGLGFVALYLILSVSMTRGAVFALACAIAVCGSLAGVHAGSPFFIDNTLFAPAFFFSTISTGSHLLNQLQQFGWIYLPALLALAWLALLARRRGAGSNGAYRRLRSADRPLLTVRLNYACYCFFCATMVIVLLLGHNPGNWLTYLMQLMAPVLLIACFSLLRVYRAARGAATLITAWVAMQSLVLLEHDFEVDMKPWAEAQALIDAGDKLLVSPLLTDRLLAANREVFHSGHTPYFRYGLLKPAALHRAAAEDSIKGIWDAYLRDFYGRLERQQFDYLVLGVWDMRGVFEGNPHPDTGEDGRAILRRHYDRTGTLDLSMVVRPGGGKYPLQVWQPKAANGTRSLSSI